MTRGRLAAWIAAFVVLLAGVVALSVGTETSRDVIASAAEDRAVDALLDRLGVTRQAAVLSWLASDDIGDNPDNPAVWIARNGGYFHGYPLCLRLASPVETTYWRAKAMGLEPCPVCCAKLLEAELNDAN